jgi:hypothetical protein
MASSKMFYYDNRLASRGSPVQAITSLMIRDDIPSHQGAELVSASTETNYKEEGANQLPPMFKIGESDMTANEAAEMLGVTPRHLKNHRSHHTGPKYFKNGHRVSYSVVDLEAWGKPRGLLVEEQSNVSDSRQTFFGITSFRNAISRVRRIFFMSGRA